ncbi:MAG: RNA methyltransferase [Bacteroidales bacterium]|jgi:tRNA (guanosine-2'-O-)-methyltransferase|nr:RNA methyltransferase [Bacteroidales bacterium]
MKTTYRDQLITYLSQFLLERRILRFDEILQNRTEHLTVVLEDIYQSQNASAVLRTCDCFGIQDVHIIENNYNYKINPDVAMGSDKWIDLHFHDQKAKNTIPALRKLKKQGYRIVATTPHKNDVNLESFDLTKGKVALVFGSEVPGISEDVMQEADEFMKIPMYGFTESFNISVSAAICLHHLVWKLHQSDIDWHLPYDRNRDLRLDWMIKSLKKPELLIQNFEKLNPHLLHK